MRREFLQLFFLGVILAAPAVAQGVGVSHLYNLSNFTGMVPYNHAVLHVDRERDEIYAVDGDSVRIFNESGMEVFRFGPDPRLGVIYDVVVDRSGDLLVLSPGLGRTDAWTGTHVVRCNYRGEPKSRFRISGLPDAMADFEPDRMILRNGRLHFVGRHQMLAAVTDIEGRVERIYDLAELVAIPMEERADTVISGFHVDADGNQIFTVPVRFRVYVVSSDGHVVGFGKGGGAPGSFGLPSGVVTDDDGNYFVADTRRNVIIVFDKNFNYLNEFGFLGTRADNLVRPSELALGNAGKIYVTQRGNRGVSVFSVRTNQ